MPYSESAALFAQLPESTRQVFYNIAAKSDMTAQQVFHYEIPDVLKSDPEGIMILLDGGEVVVATEGVPGPGPGQLSDSTTTVEMPDRDFSRVQSGENGGEYTADNVVLEDASINRSRQGADMTQSELDAAEASLEADAEVIANRVSDVNADAVEAVESVDVLDALDSVGDVVIPLGVGYKIYNQTAKSVRNSGMSRDEQTATVALATGGGVAATAALCLNPVTGPVVGAVAAVYGAVSLFNFVNRKLG